jgi:hypothetical protein
MTCRSSGYDGFCFWSWCSFRAVVGVIVRNLGRVLWNGIPHHMVLLANNQFAGGALNAEDPVFGVTPGPAHRMARMDASASQRSPVQKSEQSFQGDCKAH